MGSGQFHFVRVGKAEKKEWDEGLGVAPLEQKSFDNENDKEKGLAVTYHHFG